MKIIFKILLALFLTGCLDKNQLLMQKRFHENLEITNSNFLFDGECRIPLNQNRFIFEFKAAATVNTTIKFTINFDNKSETYQAKKVALTENKKYLELEFEKNFLNNLEGKTFSLIIDGITNLELKDYDCKLIEPQPPLRNLSIPIVKVSTHSSRIFVPFNNMVSWDVTVPNLPKHSTVLKRCTNDVLTLCEIYIKNLNEGTSYVYELSAIDAQSNEMFFSGTFSTPKVKTLKIAEVHFQTNNNEDESNSKNDYIKITNISSEDFFLKNLKMTVTSLEGKRKKNNLFWDKINATLKPGASVYVVGKNFDKSKYDFIEKNNTIKLNRISLGFIKNSKQIITLLKDDNEYFDEYLIE